MILSKTEDTDASAFGLVVLAILGVIIVLVVIFLILRAAGRSIQRKRKINPPRVTDTSIGVVIGDFLIDLAEIPLVDSSGTGDVYSDGGSGGGGDGGGGD